jgi:hypothetical protein
MVTTTPIIYRTPPRRSGANQTRTKRWLFHWLAPRGGGKTSNEIMVVDAAPIQPVSPCILGKCREIFAKCREADIATLLKATRSQHLG